MRPDDDIYADIEIKNRNLPHWHKDKCIQFVTFHLADSLPVSVRNELLEFQRVFLKLHPQPWTYEVQAHYNKRFTSTINDYIDAGYGKCWLRRHDCASIMAECLKHFDGIRYHLHSFVIMPNHVHVLVELTGQHSLSDICKSWKNFSALQINRLMGASGQLWHHESWDRLIRDEYHYKKVVNYIDKNIKQGGVIWG